MEICEREYCMYKHESADVDEESEQEEGSVNSDDNNNDEENVDDNETDRTFCIAVTKYTSIYLSLKCPYVVTA